MIYVTLAQDCRLSKVRLTYSKACILQQWSLRCQATRESGINVAFEINEAPGTFGKNNKRSP